MFSHRVEKNPAVDKTQIGSRIKEIRKKAGLTQAEFGDRIGFHKNQVYYVEVGKSIPSDGFIAAVSREFKVSYSWLRTGEANERDPVDDRLIEWLRRNPEVARGLRIRGGLD
jgi:transcriptional regulator with XRE-family HTH domain